MTIKEAIRYDPDSGKFYWIDLSRRKKAGTAGHLGADGYLRIMYKYKMYSAAPLAWFLYYGEWPPILVDHIDQNPSNNCIWNLRLSNHSLNGFNSKERSNKHGRGISFDQRTCKWIARIGKKHIGTFLTQREAIAARKEAENVYTHG